MISKMATKRVNATTKHPMISIAASFLAIVGLVLLLSGCSEQDETVVLNINDYVISTVDGFNEYGSVSFSIDYDSMFELIPVAKDTKNKASSMAQTFDMFVADYPYSISLKNGDKVNISWKENNDIVLQLQQVFDVNFVHDDYEYVVSGLADVQDYDPFDDLCFESYNTTSGDGTVKFYITKELNGEVVTWQVNHDGKNGELKNGDVLNLTIVDDIDIDAFARMSGLRIITNSCAIELSCLAEYAFDESIFNSITEKERRVFEQVINDWVLAGLNDENILANQRTCHLDGYVFYTNAEHNSEQENDASAPLDGMLIAIYEIDDQYVPGGYYVFVGLEGVFSHDVNGVYINNGQELPSSFIYYEKETIRYDYERGWGQNDEPMGFLYLDLAYAGHRNVSETLKYLEANYGTKYKHRFVCTQYYDDIENSEF